MNLLLFSNSTNAGEEYLSYTLPYIKSFLKGKSIKAVFIPYAGVTISFDEYFSKVSDKLSEVGIELSSVHNSENPADLISEAEAIIVGGGNTFQLLKLLQDNKLISAIHEKVKSGTPYIGWSAGSNVASPTICTTNDMPVIEPQSFNALNLIPFQINPHYTDAMPPGHAGETREMRISEYIIVNKESYVVGLKEATMLQLTGNKLELLGAYNCRLFKYGNEIKEYESGKDLSFLIQ